VLPVQGGDPRLPRAVRGPHPRAVVTVEILAEHLIHCWDLAAATGQLVAFTSDQVRVAEIGLLSMLSQPYAPEGFQPPIPFRLNDNGLSRLLARSGRHTHLTDTHRPSARRL